MPTAEWIEYELKVVVDFTPPGQNIPEGTPVLIPAVADTIQVDTLPAQIGIDTAIVVDEDDAVVVPSTPLEIRRSNR